MQAWVGLLSEATYVNPSNFLGVFGLAELVSAKLIKCD